MWKEKQQLATKEELIDTLWNVNLFTNAFQGVATVRINRYIMECK